jgi:hypothetical protein
MIKHEHEKPQFKDPYRRSAIIFVLIKDFFKWLLK